MNNRIELLDEPGATATLELEVPEVTQSLPAVRQATDVATAPRSRDDMLMTAMDRGYSPEQIAQFMDLRDRHEAHEAEKAFRDDFAAFRGENIIVPKTKDVDRGRGGSFKQAEYHIAANLLSPALSRHGFSFRHDQKFGLRRCMTDGVENDIGWVWVTCYLEHRTGHAEKLELEGPPGDLTVNSPTQNMQVTASYLKRQSLLAITGTATGGEDDENKMRSKSADKADAEAFAIRDEWIERANSALNDAVLMRTWNMALEEIGPLNRLDVHTAVKAAVAARRAALENAAKPSGAGEQQ